MMEEKDPMITMQENIATWRKENPQATLYEIETAVEKELDQLRQKTLERITQESSLESIEDHCPDCNRPLMRNGKKQRWLKGKGSQKIELKREQLRCSQCGLTFFPPR